MSNKAFRKDIEQKLSSPENLKTYIKVTSPGLWVIVAAVIILFAGLLLGQMHYTIHGVAIVNDKKLEIFLNVKDLSLLSEDIPVFGLGVPYEFSDLDENVEVSCADKLSDKVREVGKFDKQDWVFRIEDSIDVPNDIYPITIDVERTSTLLDMTN